MSAEVNELGQGNAGLPDDDGTRPEPAPDIVSVNSAKRDGNKVAKALFLLLVFALLAGALAWSTQYWMSARRDQLKTASAPRTSEDTAPLLNPEKTGAENRRPKLGVESGGAASAQTAAASAVHPGAAREDGIRPLRGSDGKVLVNPQGRALGVDRAGNVVEVPAITALADDPAGRRPLPGQGGQPQGGQPQGAGQPQQRVQGVQGSEPKPPSRYGGSLFAGEPSKPSQSQSPGEGDRGSGPPGSRPPRTQAEQIAEILRNAGLGGAPTTRPVSAEAPAPSLSGAGMGGEPSRPGTVGGSLLSSATPVALARSMKEQDLLLPKGRQADCVLTGRIVDEVPGFTSCVLTQNLYSNNGRVLLIERGSELTGEYGVSNQLGMERLFVTWNRLRTPEGVEVDLSSPGAERLGTAGIPGHLDDRWGARIGAALLLSFVKDITVAIINKQAPGNGAATVNVQASPGQNTVNASSALAEEVIKQTIKVRPRLTINEGDRVSVYVARDLDFSPVYALMSAGATGEARPGVR